ncbi:pilus assembly protein PilS [Photobacterium jeanii]|uniref:Pilus assembly protein PilS n=1 Tax=Photobacterium jeanii TaxID=858640 RepID=A0A178KIB6_9GAMM|nr:PilN domain-containing protein [Photobacterium jeanii]OAN17058.1 pilus assembly protein PilS [Photobacterium jeanii]PST88347.1 pilus assembly protein PilS [Photobacterium jeanii]
MINKINLLPWREAQRQQHRRRFTSALVAVCLLAVLGQIAFAQYFYAQHDTQQARNQALQQEIVRLEHRLSILPELDRQRDALNKRLNVIADIQRERNRVTRLFSLLPGLIPQGVYLESLILNSGNVDLHGFGDSNGRLATLLGNIEQTVWLNDVAMHSIIATKGEAKQDLTRFNASFSMSHPAAPLDPKDGAKQLVRRAP